MFWLPMTPSSTGPETRWREHESGWQSKQELSRSPTLLVTPGCVTPWPNGPYRPTPHHCGRPRLKRYRSLHMTRDAQPLGMYGFDAAAPHRRPGRSPRAKARIRGAAVLDLG
jgi:hypothetical protein